MDGFAPTPLGSLETPGELRSPLASSPLPGSAGRGWRERFHVALAQHERLTPEVMLQALLERLPEDPVGVFKAITATLPRELDVTTQPQLQHLMVLKFVAQAKQRGIDLDVLLEPEALPEWLS